MVNSKININFALVKYSRKSLDRAGWALLDPFKRAEVIEMVTDWRLSHLPVLRELVEDLTSYFRENNVQYAFYSQRIKRMTSIIDKLRNNQESKMGLGSMQDIGGARFVFGSVDDLKLTQDALSAFTPNHFTLERITDYISNPKSSGYRSIHYIYKYHSENPDYDGLKIELQIRTRLQHSWAMAVETASLISRTSLKANINDGSVWRGFFKLVSAIFAIKERSVIPEEYANYNHQQYCEDFLDYVDKYKLLHQLKALRVTVVSDDVYLDKPDGFCVLSIDFKQQRVTYKTFLSEEESIASTIFSQLEQTIDADEAVLLVSIAKMQEIREAYPSYFLDTNEFLDSLEDFETSCSVYRKS